MSEFVTDKFGSIMASHHIILGVHRYLIRSHNRIKYCMYS